MPVRRDQEGKRASRWAGPCGVRPPPVAGGPRTSGRGGPGRMGGAGRSAVGTGNNPRRVPREGPSRPACAQPRTRAVPAPNRQPHRAQQYGSRVQAARVLGSPQRPHGHTGSAGTAAQRRLRSSGSDARPSPRSRPVVIYRVSRRPAATPERSMPLHLVIECRRAPLQELHVDVAENGPAATVLRGGAA